MAWLVGPQLEEVKYQRIPRRKLTDRTNRLINQVVRGSLAIDFPSRRSEDREYLVRHSAKSRRHPNLHKELLRPKQLYARSLSVLALYEGKIIAHLPVDDNVSTRKPFPLGVAEMFAKLYWTEHERNGEPLVRHRYLRPGLVALSQTARTLIDRTADGDANLIDVMMGLAAEPYDPRQGVRTYPWKDGKGRAEDEGENLWLAALPGLGLELDAGADPRKVYAFGPKGSPVWQTPWHAPSLEAMQAVIMQKNRAEELLSSARDTLRVA